MDERSLPGFISLELRLPLELTTNNTMAQLEIDRLN